MHGRSKENPIGAGATQQQRQSGHDSSGSEEASTRGVCRLCLEEEAVENLVSCCACTGSIKHIHIKCLLQWQHTLWAQGQFSRALRCDICCQPYKQLQLYANSSLPLVQRVKQHWLQLYHSPEWAFKVWRGCILLGGVAAGTHHGVTGFGAGLNLGLRLARPLASLTFRLMPQLSVAAAVLPSLAPMLRRAVSCSCSLMALGVAATTAAGLLGGGVVGFCLGTVGMVRFSAHISCHAAAVAAQVAAAGVSKAAWPRALAVLLLKGVRGLQLPVLADRKAAQALL